MNLIAECEQLGYADGLAAGLDRALAGVDATAPPGTVAALPVSRVPAAAQRVAHPFAAGTGIEFVRCEPSRQARADGFGARLGAVRLGATRRLLDWTTDHLSTRHSGGEPIIRKQLVLGVLADSATSVEALRLCLLVAADVPVAVTDAHDRITVLDWEISKLLGASGYVGDGPSRTAYVSRLVANCWIPRKDSDA